MSYARFSSDDFQSDVYVYEDVSGSWTTYVAGNRAVFDRTGLPEATDDTGNGVAWFARHNEVMRRMKTAEHVAIGLPHDGAVFHDPTPAACADRLEELLALGYYVPAYAITDLRDEAGRLVADATCADCGVSHVIHAERINTYSVRISAPVARWRLLLHQAIHAWAGIV